MRQNGATSLTQKDDGEKFDQVKVAMTVLGITPDIQEDMFRVIASVMKIGNIVFKSDGKEGSVLVNPEGNESTFLPCSSPSFRITKVA